VAVGLVEVSWRLVVLLVLVSSSVALVVCLVLLLLVWMTGVDVSAAPSKHFMRSS
jgi:hypothetical protein